MRRLIQGGVLAAFVGIILAAGPLPDVPRPGLAPGVGEAWPLAFADAFLRMDPAVFAATVTAARDMVWALWPAGALLLLTVLTGRVFCGWLCPLGTCVDLVDSTLAPRRSIIHDRPFTRLRWGKHFVLLFLMTAAALGVSLVFLAAPIPLATRFVALLAEPLAQAAAAMGLEALRPFAESLELRALTTLHTEQLRFSTVWFLAAMAGVVFLPALLTPRLWCRGVCPAGALFALTSWRPWRRRRVSTACIHCGACQRRCPTAAIPDDPLQTRHTECIVCETCVRICPVEAIRFQTRPPQKAPPPGDPATVDPERPRLKPIPTKTPSRRSFMAAAGVGATAALLARTEAASPLTAAGVGAPPSRHLLRPPGAPPEPEFLARCIRCGACMAVCPTNTLQPIWFRGGVAGVFSPVVSPVIGACEPSCNACGFACPTGALRALVLSEKHAAKLGSARVLRYKCLAWEEQRQCLVCDEVCPYDAITLEPVPGNPVRVPFVDERRCVGCGFCEHHCPVRAQRAIIVEPGGAIRLSEGSYTDEAKARRLDLQLAKHRRYEPDADGYSVETTTGDSPLPPGFSEPAIGADSSEPTSTAPPPTALPPGFSEPSD